MLFKDSTRYFIMKIPNKRELQEIAMNHLSDIDFKKMDKKCTAEQFSFLGNDAILPSDNPLCFGRILLE